MRFYRTLFYTCTKDFRVHIYDARDTEKLKEIKTIHALSGQWTLTGKASITSILPLSLVATNVLQMQIYHEIING